MTIGAHRILHGGSRGEGPGGAYRILHGGTCIGLTIYRVLVVPIYTNNRVLVVPIEFWWCMPVGACRHAVLPTFHPAKS